MAAEFETTVFCDPQGEAAARVYVVAAPTVPRSDDELASLRLDGRIIGPTCRYSSTLQATIPFKHRGLTRWGDRTALVAEAVVPDPCYWTSELPFLYRAVGEVTGTATGPEVVEQPFGLRFVGAARKRLTFNGRVWVPRVVHQVEVADDPALATWRESATVLFADSADDELCRSASEAGVVVMTTVRGDRDAALAELSRLSRHPSVTVVVVKTDDVPDRQLRAAAPNTLLARFSDRKFGIGAADGIDLLIAMALADGSEWGLSWATASELPLVVMRPIDRVVPLAEARAACDALQRDLAGKYDVAGYLV